MQNKYVVQEDTEIILDDNKFILEKDDIIVIEWLQTNIFDYHMSASDLFDKVLEDIEEFGIFLWDFSDSGSFLTTKAKHDEDHAVLANKIKTSFKSPWQVADSSIRGYFDSKKVYFYQYNKNGEFIVPSAPLVKSVLSKLKMPNAETVLLN